MKCDAGDTRPYPYRKFFVTVFVHFQNSDADTGSYKCSDQYVCKVMFTRSDAQDAFEGG